MDNEINTRLAKAGSAIDRWLIILKSDLSDKNKTQLFQAAAQFIQLYGYTTWIWQQMKKNVTSHIKQILEVTS